MKLMSTFLLLTICLTSLGQNSQSGKPAYVDTEVIYTDSSGKSLKIQNSLPKGGGEIEGQRGYTHPNGRHYGYAIFWTRIINETSTTVEITINFPADPLKLTPDSALSQPLNPDLRLFIPPDIMTLDKVSMYNYGITGLKSFLDSCFYNQTTWQRTINPKEESILYVAILSSNPGSSNPGGKIRAGFELKEQNLFYKFSIGDNEKKIPAGQVLFKNQAP